METKYACVKEKKNGVESSQRHQEQPGRRESRAESRALPLAVGEETHGLWLGACLGEDQLFYRIQEGKWVH